MWDQLHSRGCRNVACATLHEADGSGSTEALMAKLLLKSNSFKTETKEGVSTTYRQGVNHLLETYAPNDVNSVAYKDILCFPRPLMTTPLQIDHGLWMNTLPVLHVYEEYFLKRIFIKELLNRIQHRMRAFWSMPKDATLMKLTYEMSPLRTLQRAAIKLNHLAMCAPTNKKS